MQEAKASWNTIYLTKNGFECQVTLRDDDETELLKRAERILARILEEDGLPLRRKPANRDKRNNPNSRIYFDENGTPRCNLRLKDGRRCGALVIKRQGRHGSYWFCPNYREHAGSDPLGRKTSREKFSR